MINGRGRDNSSAMIRLVAGIDVVTTHSHMRLRVVAAGCLRAVDRILLAFARTQGGDQSLSQLGLTGWNGRSGQLSAATNKSHLAAAQPVISQQHLTVGREIWLNVSLLERC